MGKKPRQVNTHDEASLILKEQLSEARSVIRELRLVMSEVSAMERRLKEELPHHIAALSKDAVDKVVGSHIQPELDRLKDNVDKAINVKSQQILDRFNELMDMLMMKKAPDIPSVDEIVRVTEWVRSTGEKKGRASWPDS